MQRDAAWALLTEYTKSDSLRKHAMGVEAAVRGYARKFGANEDEWGVVALLHDFDYERWPSADDHPFRRALVGVFRYAVIFEMLDDRILVVAVTHTSREPNYWLNRRPR